jgi:hypothetical protein
MLAKRFLAIQEFSNILALSTNPHVWFTTVVAWFQIRGQSIWWGGFYFLIFRDPFSMTDDFYGRKANFFTCGNQAHFSA